MMKILLTPRWNFTLAEAIDLFRGGRVPTMVAPPLRAVAFNTVLEEQIDRVAERPRIRAFSAPA
jgi:hypothetical protein